MGPVLPSSTGQPPATPRPSPRTVIAHGPCSSQAVTWRRTQARLHLPGGRGHQKRVWGICLAQPPGKGSECASRIPSRSSSLRSARSVLTILQVKLLLGRTATRPRSPAPGAASTCRLLSREGRGRHRHASGSAADGSTADGEWGEEDGPNRDSGQHNADGTVIGTHTFTFKVKFSGSKHECSFSKAKGRDQGACRRACRAEPPPPRAALGRLGPATPRVSSAAVSRRPRSCQGPRGDEKATALETKEGKPMQFNFLSKQTKAILMTKWPLLLTMRPGSHQQLRTLGGDASVHPSPGLLAGPPVLPGRASDPSGTSQGGQGLGHRPGMAPKGSQAKRAQTQSHVTRRPACQV